MKDLSLHERLERLDDWARHRNLLKPNETLFAKKQVKAQQPTKPIFAGVDAPIMASDRQT